MENTDTTKPTRTIVDAIVTKLKAVKLADGVTPAFEQVELFHTSDVMQAIETLLAASARLAVVVYGGENWENDEPGTEQISKRTHDISVVITDSFPGDESTVLYGDEHTPGLLKLKDLIYPALTGPLLDGPGAVIVRPLSGDPLKVVRKKKAADGSETAGGRWSYVLEFQTWGGKITRDLGKNPIV